MSRSSFQFPDGAILSVGTIPCDDQIHEAVHISYIHPSSPNPVVELALPTKSAAMLIKALQEHANEARFVNGEKMLEYPKPISFDSVAEFRALQKKRKRKRTGQQAVRGDSGIRAGDDT